MTTIDQLLAQLRRLDVELWTEGERLRYRAPKGTLTPEILAAMAERKADIITFLRSAQESHDLLPPTIQPIARSGELPLSFAQQRMWFLSKLEPDNTAYVETSAYRLVGSFDHTILERAINEIVRRHELLRTAFPSLEGRPAQVIAASLTIPLTLIDLSPLPKAEREQRVERLIREDKLIPMDLATGPLLRTTLVRLDQRTHVLLVTMHHIITDAWSNGVFTHELVTLYRAFVEGLPSPLPELAIQYADFAAWQRGWLQGEVLDAQLDYWRRHLAGLPFLVLPADHSPSANYAFRTAEVAFSLTPQEVDRLRELGQREGCTLFMTLLAAFKTLMLRYTGQHDIVMGTEIANRNHDGTERLIGFFVNQLVLRTNLAGDPTFRELLTRVRDVTLAAYAHQDLPFEKLVEELQPERNLSKQPLFQVGLSLETRPEPLPEFPDLQLSEIKPEYGAIFDLNLFLMEEVTGISGSFIYNQELFETSKIERMAEHYRTLLDAVVADPHRRLSALPLLTTEESARLAAWNATDTDYGDSERLLSLFNQVTRRDPEAIALVAESQQLTYAELDQRANRLAHFLIRQGVRPDTLVGICLEPCVERVISLFAILKAGGAAVAIDPSYPADRLKLMIEGSNLTLLLTTGALIGELPPVVIPTLALDRAWPTIAQEDATDPAVATTLDNLQYIIFTSGSTGMPKQIGVPQRAFLNLLHWQLRDSALAPVARTVQFSTFGFCVSFQEIFTTLCAGGTLVIVPEEVRRDPQRLLQLLQAQAVERLCLPFAALKQLAETSLTLGPVPAHLKEVVTAGEPLQVTGPIRDFFSRLAGCSLHNQYGASETHVVSALSLTGAVHAWPPLPSVGTAIANCELYVLDRDMQPLPVGIPGELYIGGTCMPRGYLNDPVLTATKLVPHPWTQKPGARLYKTGDLAIYASDASIRILGRVDYQIKIRGFRIELGEIEKAIRDNPIVQDVAVVPEEIDYEHRRLLAYVVLREETPATLSELRGFLKKRLPDHMVPAVFMSLPALPLNANGKLDYQALPEPDRSRPTLEAIFVAPRSELEEEVAQIWQAVLQIERIGVHDSFFDLGGHSLLATQVMARVQDSFGIDLPLRSLFRSPTIAEFSLEIVQQQLEQLSQEDPEVLIAELDQLPVVKGSRPSAPDIYDVVLVGARCAGASTALHLARKGYRVLMVDRTTFPSDTISTHLIWPVGVARLKHWGLLGDLHALNCPPISQVLSDMGDFPLVGYPPPIDGVQVAYCARRTGLDRMLVDAAIRAGAELWEECVVQELLWEDNRVVGIRGQRAGRDVFTVHASMVIGADGKNSAIARMVEAPLYNEVPPLTCYYYTYWSGVPIRGIEMYRRERRLITAIPTNDDLTLILTGWPHEEFQTYRADVEGNYQRTLALVPELAERVAQGHREERFWGMADLPNFFRRPYGPGWALVGDAGYHKDPYMAHGISDAFRDAELLAEAIDAAFTGQQPLGQALAGYERRRNAAALPLYHLTCAAAALEPPTAEQLRYRELIRDDQTAIDQFVGVMAGTVPVDHAAMTPSVVG